MKANELIGYRFAKKKLYNLDNGETSRRGNVPSGNHRGYSVGGRLATELSSRGISTLMIEEHSERWHCLNVLD